MMGLGRFHIVSDTEKAGREYCREWDEAVRRLELSRRLEGRVILAGEADCALHLKCNVCGHVHCIGCRESVSIYITEDRLPSDYIHLTEAAFAQLEAAREASGDMT